MAYRRLRRRLAAPKLLDSFAATYPNAFFIEIGANDGEQHDHLRPLILSRPWRGIMVEPVPYVFERLQRNYGTLDRIALENVAIADRDGELPFFHLREADEDERDLLPEWYDGIGSFSAEVVLGHIGHIPDIEQRIARSMLPSMSFESLCAKHSVERVDLLLIDTEGYDWKLLRGIDIRRHRPRLVIYEHYHLRRQDRLDAQARLEALGYETMEEGFDTLCLDTAENDELTRTWKRLRPAVRGLSAHSGQ